jgi:hypothetical protein
MREVLRRGDLGMYASVLPAIEVQLQSNIVIRRCAVWPRSSRRPKNCSLTTNGNFGTNHVAPTQRSFYIFRDKPADIPLESHAIYHVSARSAYVSLLTESEKLQSSIPANSRMRRRFFGDWGPLA